MSGFDLAGVLRRIRRLADLSQRELAAVCGVSTSVVAQAESGRRGMTVQVLAEAAQQAGLRLALLDGAGVEARPMAADAVRDQAGRRFPAHLDTRYGDQAWWHGRERYSRNQPWYTFDRVRYTRDWERARRGTPDDHLLPQPGDSPEARRAARRQAAEQRRRERRERLRAAGLLPEPAEFRCTCPPRCDQLDDWGGRPIHADDCPCSCDIG